LWVGGDRPLLIDDPYAPLSAKIVTAIAKVTDKPVEFVLNTHWHGDHTGGNETFGSAGATILAHDNVRERLSKRQEMKVFDRVVEPLPEVARPVLTYADSVTFHLGDAIRVHHVPAAHTDGDSIVHFTGANVIHAGDVVFNGMYPFIDVEAGGRIDGVIEGVARILALSDGNTKIIPGHGDLATPADLRDYRAMLIEARIQIRRLIAQGKTRDQVVAAKPTAALDEKWGQGFMKPDKWVGIVYDSMTAVAAAR
jgi:cyclase